MPDCEFNNVKCTALEGSERNFYHWALRLQKDPWTVRTEDDQGNKFLVFHWHNRIGRGDDFEVSMLVDLDKGQYDVCNVVPFIRSQLTPSEYNEHLERFVNEILIPFNRDNGNILHVVYEKCGGKLTCDYTLDIKDMWSKQFMEDLQKNFVRELYRARLELMEDVYNRHLHEIISRESHAAVSRQIAEIITQQLLRPGDCDLMMAAQCFVGMCMKKTAQTDMFDEFLTDEYRAHLSKLIGVESWCLEGAIQIGAVRTNFYSLYNEGVRNGT